jgi:hypothetical protein
MGGDNPREPDADDDRPTTTTDDDDRPTQVHVFG